jgi:hypothetical protein
MPAATVASALDRVYPALMPSCSRTPSEPRERGHGGE